MKSFKNFQKPRSGDWYVNTLLALLIIVFGIVIMNAFQHKETSWEMLRFQKTGLVLLAYIGSAESLYKDEHGNFRGNGVELLMTSFSTLKRNITLASNLKHRNLIAQKRF